jgi:hypothetical protein
MTDKFTLKTRPCGEYILTDPSGAEHGPFNTRVQATLYVAEMLGVSIKKAIKQIKYPSYWWAISKEGK